jgi:hypothetical protein
VQTELHDAKHQPDITDGGKIGMPIEEFTVEAWKGLAKEKRISLLFELGGKKAGGFYGVSGEGWNGP